MLIYTQIYKKCATVILLILQRQHVLSKPRDDVSWRAEPEVAQRRIAVARIFLNDAAQRCRRTRAISYLARDDVDDAAHRVRTIERGHRAAHDLDPLDSSERRKLVGLHAAGASVHGLTSGLAAAVEHDERIFAGHAANDNVGVVWIISDDADALYIAHGIAQRGERTGFQLFAREDRDAGRRLRNALLVTSGGHDDGIIIIILRFLANIILCDYW